MEKSFWTVKAARPDRFRAQRLLAVLGLLFTSHALWSQTPLLERTITLSLQQERLDIALTKISQQGGFTFSYNPAAVDVSRVVTFNFAGNTVREVLELL